MISLMSVEKNSNIILGGLKLFKFKSLYILNLRTEIQLK